MDSTQSRLSAPDTTMNGSCGRVERNGLSTTDRKDVLNMSGGPVKTLRTSGGIRTHDRVPRILMADDSRNEHLLMLMAAEEVSVPMELQFVDDGSALMDHFSKARASVELPDVIVLDLRMPILDGHSTLVSLKSDPELCRIPVVVFTTSTSASDVQRSLDYGASFVRLKPSGFLPMMAFVRELHALCVAGDLPDDANIGINIVADEERDSDFRTMDDLSIDFDTPRAA